MIRNVVIVGGGSAGWMTAAAFERLLPQIKVTLLESPNIPTIGVGESTLGHINVFMRLLGLEDKEWMKDCDATYKVGIRFTNFYKNDGTYWDYPFVDPSDEALPAGLKTFWFLKNAYPEEFGHPNSFARLVNGNSLLMDHNKLSGDGRYGTFGKDYSYHLDATKFAHWLKDNVCHNVKHKVCNVTGYCPSKKGIDALITNKGKVKGDLFIDCTGFKSLLLEQYMGVGFKSYENILPNNKATFCRIPHDGDFDREIYNYTNSSALGNGWVWEVPLWNRTGIGYVWCNDFQDQAGAEQEFRDYIYEHYHHYMPNEFKTIDIRNGKHDKAWVKNVVACGLSYGFLEPLESTGLLTTHEQIRRIIETLQTRDGLVSSVEKELFNESASREIESFADFIAWHYAFSARRDTEYWQYVTEDIDYHRNHYNMPHPEDNPFRDLSFAKYRSHEFPDTFGGDCYVLAGNDYATIRGQGEQKLQMEHGDPPVAEWKEMVDNHMKEGLEYVQSLPSTYEYLKDVIYFPKETN